MDSTHVYVSCEEPGAPRAGDLVVVETDGAPGTKHGVPGQCNPGWRGQVVTYEGGSRIDPDHPFLVSRHRDNYYDRVHAIRRPTPEELATYHLALQGALDGPA